MARRRKLRDTDWEIIHEKLDVLIAQNYQVEALTDYQFRVNGVLDIYPVNRRWHDLRSGGRGFYYELIAFIHQSKL